MGAYIKAQFSDKINCLNSLQGVLIWPIITWPIITSSYLPVFIIFLDIASD